MRIYVSLLLIAVLTATHAQGEDNKWYSGDERCPPPKDDGTYSAPYNALDYPRDYPIFPDADKSGWSCSYQRDDGVIIQYGDSRTPQQQWLNVWGGNDNNN